MFDLESRLLQQRESDLYRSRRIAESGSDVRMRIDGKDCLVFCSNDYLGLASHPDVKAAFISAANEHGVGSGAAHLVTGHHRAHHALEEELADFTGRERTLLFSTGYMANLAAVTALTDRHDEVFGDKLNHASLIDAARLSEARHIRYKHADDSALEQRLATSSAKDKLVITDGVFSMDGDIAPLPALSAACRRHNAWLMVDDAHGLGVLGRHGAGVLEHFAMHNNDAAVMVGTLGKAFGTFGAFVAGSESLIETLIQKARPYIYTTALPVAVAEATHASLKIIQTDSGRREHLHELIKYFCQGAAQLGLPLMPSATAIQPLLVGEAVRAVAMSENLLKQGILVSAIRPPTVPDGSSRLRITLTAAHTRKDVERLLTTLEVLV
ncbi:8-amino-7-oxononanoate synthase [Sulfuriflexus sp.]|uniref:8-amino-7-oxononanoate synthase n=1 Tax=Sulfuriflexus sp. TaxID=2015443 RepID=UPI0028CBC820|nr:8-amino-7-oxononanoate synthase [Sulfuriflexus sp.]MDT8403558.1 8-amino-7-oxononanoate synthase [Sulfuriflexus sp.]